MAEITLSKAVRSNLLNLQSTAAQLSKTQQRLATGLKVNSALDNPSSFFTASSLNSRAGDLSALLDNIGQATNTLDAANNGITSLTKLVQNAKSIASQARSATGATNTYSSLDSSANILSSTNLNGTESTASKTGANTAAAGNLLEAQSISIAGKAITETTATATASTGVTDAQYAAENTNTGVSNGTVQLSVTSRNGTAATFNVALNGETTQAAVKAAFDGTTATVNGVAGVRLDSLINVSFSANALKLDAANTGVDFTINAAGAGASTASTLTDVGLTGAEVGAAKNSSSLFDQLSAAGAVNGDTLTISGTGSTGTAFTTQTITFGDYSGANNVNTLADLNTKLAAAATASSGGFSASVNGSNQISITKPAGTKSSVTVGGTIGNLTATKGVLETTSGDVFGTHNSQATLENLGSTLAVANGGPQDLSGGGSLSFTVNNQAYTVGLGATDRVDDVISKLSSSAVAANLSFSKTTDGTGHDHIKVDAKNSSVDFTINANSASAALGLTSDTTTASTNNSTSLLDLLDTSFGGAGNASGKTLTVAANGGATQTITFGTGTNQVQTLDQFNTALSALSGVTASVSNGGALAINVASGTSQTSLTIGGTATAKLGLTDGSQSGTVISTTANATRSRLQSDFNTVLTQIDALSKDASYNGINLLNGDDLKVSFNENGSSSLTISGVTFDSNHLGLTQINGDKFQDNSQIDSTISTIDTALGTLRSQSATFGSNLSVVQNRQDFTKNMINTLQTGASSLTLADSNEEAANVLALQTRQQLSSTALSLANQADQAVLRLF